MTLRELKLPGDLLPLGNMLVQTFQYPENPEWSIQADEEENISRTIRSLKRVWPLIRIGQLVSKPMRDVLRGYLWEENGQIGAVVIAHRHGSTNTWGIGTVGVLPEFRRRGLARKLLTKTLDLIREKGGKHIVLSVIDRNVPAYSLYKSLGFEHYNSQIEYNLTPPFEGSAAHRPAGYFESKLDRFDWQQRYALAGRITPKSIRQYEPVEPGRYKPPALDRLIDPMMDKLQKRKEHRRVFRIADTIVGHFGYQTLLGSKGTSSIWAQLDPEHADLAPYMLGQALHSVAQLSPTLRVQFSAASWMPALGAAAEELGFTKRLEYHTLGLLL